MLEVTPANQDVPYTAGTASFAVIKTGEGPVDWTAAVTSGQEWLTIQSGASGTNAGTIVAAFQENSDTAQRAGTIQVTPTDIAIPAVNVTVTQAGLPVGTLDVTPVGGLASDRPRGRAVHSVGPGIRTPERGPDLVRLDGRENPVLDDSLRDVGYTGRRSDGHGHRFDRRRGRCADGRDLLRHGLVHEHDQTGAATRPAP